MKKLFLFFCHISTGKEKEEKRLRKAVYADMAQTTGSSYLKDCSAIQFCIVFQDFQLKRFKQERTDNFCEALAVQFQI